MKRQILVGLFSLALFCALPVTAQKTNCLDFQKLVDATYSFKPSKLSSTERDVKSAAMDKFWNEVKADRQKLLPCLREAINLRRDDKFFRFDASNLLVELDQSAESKKNLIKTYSEVDFGDIDLRYWMSYIVALGVEGFDTSAAGESWLRHPKPEYILPQHGALGINKDTGALFIYGSMDEAFATPALAKIAGQETHPAREIAVRMLMLQATAESYQALRTFNQTNLSEKARKAVKSFLANPVILAAREGSPKTTRQQFLAAFNQLTAGKAQPFLQLAAEVPDGEKDAVAVLKPEDVPLVRRARRIFAAGANLHSAKWYLSFTHILTALTWQPETTEQKAKVK